MNLSIWFYCLAFGCLACSKPSTTFSPNLPVDDGPYKVTALLNDSTWFGSASASRTLAITGQSACTSNRFDVRFSTDLPFNNTSPKQLVTGCLGDCIPTQVLVFHNVPLAVGTYNITTLNSCAGQNGAANYYWLLGGDAIIKTYNTQPGSNGWIQVTGYDADKKVVEGTFDIDLSDQSAKTARFKKGVFKAPIQ
ncbi:hypothetical protein [Spirosoma flavum]|uniref:Uncharacterized protein n=1 Tax=Spirosoma flavum TaxID=2048557 RepID=A0ABW6AUM7_9BACT